MQTVSPPLSEGWQLATTSTGGIYRDVVVCYKLDRISRSIRDFANLMFELEEMGVSLVLVTQNFDSSSPMGRLCLHFLSSFSEFERAMIRDRIRDKAAARAEQGLWVAGRPPFGKRSNTSALWQRGASRAFPARGIWSTRSRASSNARCADERSVPRTSDSNDQLPQQAAYTRAYGIERDTAAQAHIAAHQMQTMRQNQTAATSVTKLTFSLRRNSKNRLTLQAPQPVALEKGKRPTKRAIRMANALRLEQMLHAGQFRSLADIRMTYGISLSRRLISA